MRITQPFVLCLTLLMITPLSGCFFFYIPGSVIDSVSDSVTGATGKNCVGKNAMVGDKIRMPDGTVGTIKSLSGTSSRCKDERLPIRALVELSNIRADGDIAYESRITMQLSDGWVRQPLTDAMRARNVLVHAINKTKDMGLILRALKRDGITNLSEFANSCRADQSIRLTEPQESDISRVNVNGHNAFRFDVTGKSPTKLKITYRFTIIEGATEIALLNAWTSAANFNNQMDTIEDLARSIAGLDESFVTQSENREGAPAGTGMGPRSESAIAAEELTVSSYTARIRQQINDQLENRSSAEKGHVKVELRLLPSGNVSGVQIESSSGNPEFDAAVLRAISAAQPLAVPVDSRLFKLYFQVLHFGLPTESQVRSVDEKARSPIAPSVSDAPGPGTKFKTRDLSKTPGAGPAPGDQ